MTAKTDIENTEDSSAVSVESPVLFGTWLPSKDAPKRETVIVGDAKNTGAGWHNGHGQWFAYGSSIPMETPTHYMPFPSLPNAKDQT
jgi:hypothetical protein